MKTKILLILISFCCLSITNAQKNINKIEISGYVTDINNQPLKDVVFLVDNVKTDVNINRKGFYILNIPIETKLIMVFSPKNGIKEIDYKGEKTVNFIFQPSDNLHTTENTQNQVDIGYGTIDKDKSTGSVGVIERDNNNYTNIYNMIAGKVPGVIVTGTTIRIRGNTSINASNDPLFIVDGMIVSSFDNVNPNEVDNINVLKGPNAAIYGVRGANGVILINLKKAKKDN